MDHITHIMNELLPKTFRLYSLPMKSIPLFRHATVLLGILLLTGCQSAKMAIPSDLEARSETYPCIGRNGFSLSEQFSFGPYRVENVHRGWTTRTKWGIVFFERSHARQQYEYTLIPPRGEPWQGQAATGVKKSDLKGTVAGGELTWGLESDLNFVVQIGRTDAPRAWTLVLAEGTRDSTFKGQLSDGTTTYRVEGTHALEGSPIPLMDTAGYLIYDGTRLLAAIDLINAGSVHLDTRLPAARRDPLAAAAAALLLYRDISD